MKKSLNKVLRFIAAIPISIILSYLLWLVFYWLTPYAMKVNTISRLLLYVLILQPIILSILVFAASFVITLIHVLVQGISPALKWLFVLPFAFHGFSAMMLPWWYRPHGAIPVIMSVFISIYAVINFTSACIFILKRRDEDED